MATKTRKKPEAGTTALAKAPAEGEVLEPGSTVPDKVVDEVYTKIVGMQRDATVDLAVEMGKLIVDTFYQGDFQGWREHGNKEASLRKLAARFENDEESTGMSAAGIYRVVAIYELDKRLNVSARKHLTVTHIRSVIGLPPAEQKRLIDEAEGNEWTTRKLEEVVAKVRKKSSDGRGRPALPAFVKTLNALGKLAIREDAFADLDQINELDEEATKGALTSVTGMRERLVEIEGKLQARLKKAGAAT